MLAIEFTYQMQVEHLSRKNKISVSKSRTFIKEYRRLLKMRLAEGMRVEIAGIASISPDVRESLNIVYERTYTYSDQVKDLVEFLEIDAFSAHHLLKTYIRMLIKQLKLGYSIKIKGVMLVKPSVFAEGMLGYVTRLSPTLEKPEKSVFKVKHMYGKIEEIEIDRDRMIFSLDLYESLGSPERVREVERGEMKLNYVDDSILG